MKMSENHERFSLDTDITGRDISKVVLSMSYILGKPSYFNATLSYDDKGFLLLAIVDSDERAFSIDIKTPYFDDVSFSGQFGSTTLRTLYSLKQGRVKRDVSVEYSKADDGFYLEFVTPLTRMKRLSLQRRSDTGSFSFEVDGSYNIAVGFQYDLANFTRLGNLKLNVHYPEYDWQYHLHLIYDIPHNLSSGINGKFLLENNNREILSAKLSRTVGSTFCELRTPFVGWREVKLNIYSDWKSVAEIRFQRESRLTNIHLEQHGLYHYSIFFQTPFKGYENIAINSRKTEEKILIQIKNANVLISEISVMVHIDDLAKAKERDHLFIFFLGS